MFIPDPQAGTIFDRDFYAQSALTVARSLLGAKLVRVLDDRSRMAGTIVETEAYTGTNDLASHGRARKTPRNLPMWGEPGHAYVYLTYGMYWMLNIAVEPAEHPAAVLIRAIQPTEGLDHIAARRPNSKRLEQVSGPARLCLALQIGKAQNTLDMIDPANGLYIERDQTVSDSQVRTGPRINLGKNVAEPWLSIPWRWWVGGNLYVSVGSGKLG